MKIAVNTRFLLHNKLEGIGWFTYETLRRMVKNHPEHEFHFLFDRAYHPSFIFAENVIPHVVFPPARHPLLWYWWFEWSVPGVLKKIQPDIFLSTDGYCSLKTKVPTVMVVHDLAFEHFPEYVNKISATYYKHFSPLYAKRAEHIVTVSEFTKQDIVTQYGIPSEKISVAHNGASEIFKPLSNAEKISVKNEIASGKNYFVYAGSLHPRKNIARLFRAFDVFKEKSNSDMQLVLAGARGWMLKEIDETYRNMKHQNDVVFTGHLASKKLARVVAAADAMVYVSMFEGFGIPILEALHCDVPVITSNVSSMPEVAGNAGLLVNPIEEHSIAKAMIQLYENDALKQQLIFAGKTQRQKFSWDITAEKLWNAVNLIGKS